jgi:hypothetical protein
VHDERRVAQLEVLDERPGEVRVAVVRVPAEVGRLVRAPEAGQVGRDAAEPGVAHGRDDLAPQERPRRLAVPEDDGTALALVQVRDADPVDLSVPRGVREVGQVGIGGHVAG